MLDLDLLLKAVDASTDGVVIAEQEGSDRILIYVNRAFEELTGYDAEEILYQDCRFLQGDDRDQAARGEIRGALEEGRPVRAVLRNYRKDGSMFWNELSITPVFNALDNLTYFIGVQRDVTELVAVRKENQRLRQRLAALERDRRDPDSTE